jgi:hypothetical protein
LNREPIADAGGPYQENEGTEILFSAANSSDPDGDSLQYRWDFDSDGIWDTDWSDQPTASTLWIDDWAGEVSVEVTDGYMNSSAPTPVTVLNADPLITLIDAPLDPVQIGSEVFVNADFDDPGTEDIHTATCDWGDETTTEAEVMQNPGSGTASCSYGYSSAGVYTLSIIVNDDDSGSDEEIFQYIVIYDPDGGFVTGGGWITSPEGAYTPDPTLTGKGTFGFVSKYKKGANVPTGNTEFHFKVADLKFKSDSYQWLVVAGPKAQFNGTGTINGEGEYGFMLTAIDGEINGGGGEDKFRIKIWDVATDLVIYDNKIDAADDADPDTVLGGGSIKIHKAK